MSTVTDPFTSIVELRRDPLGLFVEGMQRASAVVPYRFGPFRAVLVNRSEDVEHVLVKNHDNYVKGRNYEPLKLTLGEGLLTSEGALWRRQRKLIQPAFHHKSLAGFVGVMSQATQDLLDRWAGEDIVDVHREMMRLTFRVVGLTLFSTDVEGDADEIGDALAFLLTWTNDRTEAMVRVPLWLPTPGNIRFRRARERFDTLVYRIIRARRRQPEQKGDLLDMLLAASGEMSEEQLRDELITLASAGHETTANALSWTFYLLSKHPEVERRVREEVREVLGDRPPALSDLAALEYTEQVILEAMRLYPPVWGFERQALEEDVIGGQKVTPGTFVMIVPYSIHRDPTYWSNPEGFDPDRFAPGAREARPRFAYLPFGGGPRVCIGNAFAMMEAKIVLAMVVREMGLELVPGHPIVEEPLITLRPKDGVLASVRPRAPSTPATRPRSIPPRHVEATPGTHAP